MSSEFFKNLLNNINTWLTLNLNIDTNVISINNHKDIKIFSQNVINIMLKASQSIQKFEKSHIIFEIVISS